MRLKASPGSHPRQSAICLARKPTNCWNDITTIQVPELTSSYAWALTFLSKNGSQLELGWPWPRQKIGVPAGERLVLIPRYLAT